MQSLPVAKYLNFIMVAVAVVHTQVELDDEEQKKNKKNEPEFESLQSRQQFVFSTKAFLIDAH